jgi:Kef-type K+ transport system membrane component KefB
MAAESAFLHLGISMGVLLFAAKLMAELFHRIRLPVVLGELIAGIIVDPSAIGGLQRAAGAGSSLDFDVDRTVFDYNFVRAYLL